MVATRPGLSGAADLSRRLQSEGTRENSNTVGRPVRALGTLVHLYWLDPEAALERVCDQLAKRIGKQEVIHLLEDQISRLRSG